ncbi:MAG TPA: flagellar hook-associated protein FlgK [Fimbriimonadaceae bacterium]|nr:flagellar hook-associated protein FlgK [Fimbriimonadaceae bacterium]
MAANALQLLQRAMDTAGHNISNVNTPGYSRQTVEFKTSMPLTIYSQGWKALGTGTILSSISRVRDAYLEQNARNNAGSLGKYQTLSDALQQIQSVFQEPGDSGIAAAMDQFFDAWSALGSNPSDSGARLQVQSAGATLANRIRSSYAQLSTYGKQLDTQTTATVDRINELGQQIFTLNKEIRGFAATQGTPNDLMDQRDAAVRELSGLIDTKVETFKDGSYSVYVAGYPLVDGIEARSISPKSLDPATGTFTSDGVTFTLHTGSLSGQLQAMQQLQTQKGQLDTLANQLRTQFNTLHQTGIDQDGNTGINFFNDSVPQTGAIDLDLSAEVKASPRAIAAGVSGAPGDGGLALSFSQMRDNAFATLGNKSFHDFYLGNVGLVGSQASYYDNATTTEQGIATQIASQVAAKSGVSLDDEMADLTRFQRSYQAAAKALTIYDQTAQDLINMVNR